MSEPLFTQLRTREQLGYMVHGSSRRWTTGVDSVELLVQSSVRDPVYLHQRVLDFLHNFEVCTLSRACDVCMYICACVLHFVCACSQRHCGSCLTAVFCLFTSCVQPVLKAMPAEEFVSFRNAVIASRLEKPKSYLFGCLSVCMCALLNGGCGTRVFLG